MDDGFGLAIGQTIQRILSHSAVRYLLVGGAAFLIDVGLLAALHDLLRMPLVVATPTAFISSFALTFILQRWLTFNSDAGLAASAVRYTMLVAINTLATTAIVSGIAALGAPWIVGKIVAVGSTTVWNFFLYKYWIFANRGHSRPDA
jgi:putative flippase GtrA